MFSTFRNIHVSRRKSAFIFWHGMQQSGCLLATGIPLVKSGDYDKENKIHEIVRKIYFVARIQPRFISGVLEQKWDNHLQQKGFSEERNCPKIAQKCDHRRSTRKKSKTFSASSILPRNCDKKP